MVFLSKRIVYWLLFASRGGPNRVKVMRFLQKQPSNLKQLSDALQLDYKTVQHHVDLMSKHGLLETIGEGYGKIHFVSQELKEMQSEFEKYFEKIE